jgi:hypothetical protein
MSTHDRRLIVSACALQRSFAFACVLLLLGPPANAGSTVLQFAQVSSADSVTATDNGSGTTILATTGTSNGGMGESIYVQITNFLGATETNLYAYETFVGVTSVGLAGTDPFSGYIEQKFSGTVEFTSGVNGAGTNYLTAMFQSSTLSPILGGAPGGTEAGLSATQPPDSLVLTSQYASFDPATGMSLGFSNVSPGLQIGGDGSIGSFTGQNAGTFSASIDPVPEPSTLFMASVAVVIGSLAYCNKQMKAESEVTPISR